MKLTTIFGSAIAAVGLAACGSTVAPTISPTLALTVAPTVAPTPTATPTATPIPTPSPSESPSPSASASPSPTEGPCGYAPCGTGWGYDTTCAVPGTAQGGSLIVTFTAGNGQTAPVLPDTIAVDGNTLDVTSNPFISGAYSAGLHSVTIEGFTGPFTIKACGVITALTTCSPPGFDDGSATFSGMTVGDMFVVADIVADYIPSNPFTMIIGAAGSYTFTESRGVTTMATGNFTIAACAVPTPTPYTDTFPRA
jgi:hypothetical protein